jgi:uncharacterized protein YukJ
VEVHSPFGSERASQLDLKMAGLALCVIGRCAPEQQKRTVIPPNRYNGASASRHPPEGCAMVNARMMLMATRTYGVLTGRVKAGRLDPGGNSPHYEIWIDAGEDYRVAVNVRSVDGSEVLVHYDPAYGLPTKRDLPALAAGPSGFTALSTGPAGAGLDYLRDALFSLADMHPIPPDGTGVTRQNLLDAQIQRAIADPAAVAIAFGDGFRDPGSDPIFGFSAENGVHDIHMMQGNSGTFAADNRINGDGALFVHYGDGTTMALFIRFATQSTTTGAAGAPA